MGRCDRVRQNQPAMTRGDSTSSSTQSVTRFWNKPWIKRFSRAHPAILRKYVLGSHSPK
jgi:hypothetical protein